MSAPALPSLLVSHWQAAWALDAQAVLYASIYLGCAARLEGRWPRRRTLSFLAGIAAVLVALQSGIDAYDGEMLSVHMAQHMVLLTLAPLLLLGGHPILLLLRTIPAGRRRSFVAALRRAQPLGSPIVCLSIFYAAVLATHLPAFYDATLAHPLLHDAEHVIYLFAGAAMLWPLLDADPLPSHRLGGLGRLIYIIAAMLPMAIVGAYLNRHPTLVYAAYGPPARTLGISAVVDQQNAGAIMWVVGDVIMVAVGLWSALRALVAEERRQQARDTRALSTPGAL